MGTWHLAKKCPDPGRHVETYHFVYAIPGIVLTLSVSRGRYVVTLKLRCSLFSPRKGRKKG